MRPASIDHRRHNILYGGIQRRTFRSALSLPVTANLRAWWRADSLSLNDNDAVGSWPDSGPNGHDLSQSTTAKKPTFKTNIQNGKPVVRFDGSDDKLVLGAALSSATAGTIFAVLIPRSVSGQYVLIGQSRTSDTSNFFWLGHHSAATGSAFISTVIGGAEDRIRTTNTMFSLNTGLLFVWKSSDTAWSMQKNDGSDEGETVVSGSDTGEWFGDIPTAAQFSLGALVRSDEVLHWQVDVGEIIIYDALLSSGDIASVKSYLNDRWALY